MRSLVMVEEASIESPVAFKYDVVADVKKALFAKRSDEVELVVEALNA